MPLAVYAPALGYDFVWDDDHHITENPYLGALDARSLEHFWTEPHANLYIPVVYTAWSVVRQLGPPPAEPGAAAPIEKSHFHVATLLFHLLSGALVFLILRSLLKDEWASLAGALLFAVHPVQVEPVAWVSGLKDTLSGFFALLAVWQYGVYRQAKRAASEQAAPSRARPELHYGAATAAFTLALLAKPSTVVVPLLVLVLDLVVWRVAWRESLKRLAPWLLGAAAIALVTAEVNVESHERIYLPPLVLRPFIFGDALLHYLVKLVLPLDLAPIYPKSPREVAASGAVYLAWLVPAALGLGCWYARRLSRLVPAAALWFAVGLLPVSGLVYFAFQSTSTVADRYLYLPMLGPALLFGYGLSRLRRRAWTALVAIGVVVALGALSRFEVLPHWRNNERFWTHAIGVNPAADQAYYNRGLWWDARGELGRAFEDYSRAIELHPFSAAAHVNRGIIHARRGQHGQALGDFDRAIAIDSRNAAAFVNRGALLAMLHHPERALVDLDRALELDPQSTEALRNRGNVHLDLRRPEQAMSDLSRAIALAPGDGGLYYHRARAHAARGDYPSAERDLAAARRRGFAVPPAFARKVAESL